MGERDASGRIVLGRSTNAQDEQQSSPGLPRTRAVLGKSSGSYSVGNSAESQLGLPESLVREPALPRRSRRSVKRVLAVGFASLLAFPFALFALGWWQFSKIPTVNVDAVMSTRSGRTGTNYLIVGTDSREGISAEDPNSGAFLAGEVSGSRTDTIMVLHVDGSTSEIASIPRDLWVVDPATGQKGRINSTFASGPTNLIRAVQSLGIPIDQYLEINFVSFGKLVDSVGGITVDFRAPAKDERSGLSVESSGPQHLNGTQALAYVRSRYYTELIDGKWRIDGTADIGRTERQRAFLTALLHEMTNERNPIRLLSLPSSIGNGMKRGSTFSYIDAIGLAWTLKDVDLQPVAIPVTPRRTSGGADVLELQPDAGAVIQSLAS